MKNERSKTAFTLIELIVSTLLVAIVLLGIFSISMVLSNNSQDYGQRYLVTSETQITLNHILNNAALAVGSLNPNDQAILIGGTNNLVGPNGFCIHQAGTNPLLSTSNPVPGQNLIGSPSDIWLCYFWVAASNEIEWCAEQYPANAVTNPGTVPNPRGATRCPSAPVANLIPNPATGANITILGTANTGFAALPPTFTSSASQLLFSITLQNCLNNSAASCNGGGAGISSDPANNPEVVVSGSITPSQVSNN